MAATKLEFLGDVYAQRVKNDEGDFVKRTRRTGDVIEVSSAQAESLLALEVGGRPLFKKVEEEKKAEPAPAPSTKTATASSDSK